MNIQQFESGIRSSFLASTAHNHEFQAQILSNNRGTGEKVLNTLLHELRTCTSFRFHVAFVTSSGLAPLKETLKELEIKGVKGKVIVSSYLFFTQPVALESLMRFSNIELRLSLFDNAHWKGYLFEHQEVLHKKTASESANNSSNSGANTEQEPIRWQTFIVGSSNLTGNALTVNRELNVKIYTQEESDLYQQLQQQFEIDFEHSRALTPEVLKEYEEQYALQKIKEKQLAQLPQKLSFRSIEPNGMQTRALASLQKIHDRQDPRALIISATGTGKTFLVAFDVKRYAPKRFLFLVHREVIARKAMESFQLILGPEIQMGLYTGNQQTDAPYLFSTVQTLSRPDHLNRFEPNHFDYIVIDETHRSGAATYQRIIDYFQPQFLLGMTATPDRMDGFDIYGQFNHVVAHEIRLKEALEEDILAPFHYYGIADIVHELAEDGPEQFNQLVADERVQHIVDKVAFYGTDNGILRGLIFCSRNEESAKLGKLLAHRGFRTLSLNGASTEEEREQAIQRLEADADDPRKLDYLLTVDIFNEGVDIPSVNQVILLRPTQSAIVFIQQIGRGLRKTEDKEYVTVLDFIGNYANNFLIPIALYGDTSYNKDQIRRNMINGSFEIPGASSVSFERIAKERIFQSLNKVQLNKLALLKADYLLLKYKLGRIPAMMDFLRTEGRDPLTFANFQANKRLSYTAFINKVEGIDSPFNALSEHHLKVLQSAEQTLSHHRIEDLLTAKALLQNQELDYAAFCSLTSNPSSTSKRLWESVAQNLTLEFDPVEPDAAKNSALAICVRTTKGIGPNELLLQNPLLLKALEDPLDCLIVKFHKVHDAKTRRAPFQLYEKYSRRDVFLLLNFPNKFPNAQSIGGYWFIKEDRILPIFITYHKKDFTFLEDKLLSPQELLYFSKPNRSLNSPEVQWLRSSEVHHIVPIFIKKNDDEGIRFYFMGYAKPQAQNFRETQREDKESGEMKRLVELPFLLDDAVRLDMFSFLES